MNGVFYSHNATSAWFNMAFDEWLFDRLEDIDGPPLYVRLYTWDKGAVTFGYNQRYDKAVNSDLLENGIAVIRRITGGRAIFHDPSELTLTVAARTDLLPEERRSLSATNRIISSAIVSALTAAGLETAWKRHSDRKFVEKSESVAACFDSVTRYEVAAGHTKIAGGAQRRMGNRFIHQGSLKVNGVSACPAVGQKAAEAPPLEGEEGRRISLGDFSPRLIKELTGVFGIPLRREELTREERLQVADEMTFLQKNPLSKRPAH
jgi:lipoate-protein ligase A